MPSKVYEIMASARPVLASADWRSDLWELVTSTACGVCIEPGEPEKLAAAIHTLRANDGQRFEMGRRGRAAAERFYSRDAVVTQYDELVHSLTRKSEVRAW
jgi:glycosyltransferase involved in cell wall biosynthesis